METTPNKVFASRTNLFCSDGGTALMPEICLQVIELLIESNPKSVGRLLLVSKSLFNLLASCERSMTKTISRNEHNFININGLEPRVIASHDRIKNNTLHRYTYPWLCEMFYRKEIVQFLISHEITEMVDTIDGWPSSDVSKKQFQTRMDLFKTQAFSSLFRLADCIAGINSPQRIRKEQSKFLHSLSTKELACLGVMIEVMGQNFFFMKRSLLKPSLAKHALLRSNFLQLTSSSSNTPLPPPQSPPHIGETSEYVSDDFWMRELTCVFEHLIHMYGPFFAWAYFEGSKDKIHRSDKWALSKLREGLDNMHAFELGNTMTYASLQSVLWQAFRQKYSCGEIKCWNIAKILAESEMILKNTEDNLCT